MALGKGDSNFSEGLHYFLQNMTISESYAAGWEFLKKEKITPLKRKRVCCLYTKAGEGGTHKKRKIFKKSIKEAKD